MSLPHGHPFSSSITIAHIVAQARTFSSPEQAFYRLQRLDRDRLTTDDETLLADAKSLSALFATPVKRDVEDI